MNDFIVRGLPAEPFAHLYGSSDEVLRAGGARRCLVDHHPGFPDRIEMRDLEVGEYALLVNYTHQDANTPYRASHAIFVREGATEPFCARNQIPIVLRSRTLSVRAFDVEGMIVDASLCAGDDLEGSIERLFANVQTAYLHVHYATFGCYAARIDR
jgi:hypothetical protein